MKHRIIATAAAAVVLVSSTAIAQEEEAVNNPFLPISYGETMSGFLTAADDSLADGSHYKMYLFSGEAGDSITIAVNGHAEVGEVPPGIAEKIVVYSTGSLTKVRKPALLGDLRIFIARHLQLVFKTSLTAFQSDHGLAGHERTYLGSARPVLLLDCEIGFG